MKMGPQSDSVVAAQGGSTNRTDSAAGTAVNQREPPSLVPAVPHSDRLNHELQMDKLHQKQNQNHPTSSSSSSSSSSSLRQRFDHLRSPSFVDLLSLTVPLS